MNRLGQFWYYVTKVFALPTRLRAIRDERPQAVIPTHALSASLLLGAVLRTPSRLQLQAETARRGWQRLVGWKQPISDDALGYVLERYRVEDWRAVLVAVNRTLKAKAFESPRSTGSWSWRWMPMNSSRASTGVVRTAASAAWRSRTRWASR
jgi:hypothetical protein